MNWKSILGDVAPVLGGILGGPAGGAVGGMIAHVLGVGSTSDDLANALKSNPALLEKVKELEINQQTHLADLEQQLKSGQIAINMAEAQSPKMFIAGARPFILWVCGFAFTWQYVLLPIANWIAIAAGHPVKLPPLDLNVMMPVLMGLLGLGGYRTFEKVKGVNQNHG